MKCAFRLLLSVTLLALPGLAQAGGQTQTCAESLESPVYPALARQARIAGIVKASFEIGQDGRPSTPVLEGNRLLTGTIESILSRAQFNSQCAGKMELLYRFVIAGEEAPEARTLVTFRAPNEFLVTVNPRGLVCTLSSVAAK